jgi:nucleoside-diphosphate-sugar epimerase
MKKVVITGANGFIGSRLSNYFSEHYDVTPLVRKNADINLLKDNLDINFINYKDMNAITKVFDGKDILIHCAAITRGKDWTDFKKNNVQLTEILIEIANQTPSIKHVIFLSSQAAAGPAISVKPKTETDMCNPISLYGKSKLLAEHQIKKKCQKPYTIIRPAAVYGPGDKDFLHYFKLINKGLSFSVGKDDKFLNMIYVDELVSLIERCFENEKAFQQIFFASDGNMYSWEVLIEAFTKVMHKKVKHIALSKNVVYKTAQIVEVTTHFNKKQPLLTTEKVAEMMQNYWLVDNTKSIQELGFTTQSTFGENLQLTLDWYRAQGWI